MSFPFLDNTVETTTIGGTGSYELAGPVTGFTTFVAEGGDGNTVFYVAVGNDGTLDEGEKEFGYGTITDASPDTLSRNVIYSTNGDAEVDWTSGETKTIYSAPIGEVFSSMLATHKGSSRPAWLKAGGLWVDDATAGQLSLYLYDGTNDIFIVSVDTARNISGLSGVSPFSGFRNRVINGGMAVDQRNEGAAQTFTAGAGMVFCVDRFFAQCTGANVTGQRSAGVAATGASGLSPYRYIFTGAASVTAISFGTTISAEEISALQSSTITIPINTSNSLLTSTAWAVYYADSADDFSSKTLIDSGSITIDGTYTNYDFQVALPANAANGIAIVFSVGAQTSGTWAIGDVQAEPGSVATPFERRPLAIERSLCERYMEKSYNDGVVSGTSTNAGRESISMQAALTDYLRTTVRFKTPKRITPSVTVYSTTGASNRLRKNNASDVVLAAANISKNSWDVEYTATHSAGDFYWWQWDARAEVTLW